MLDMITYSTFVSKLEHSGLDRWISRWVKNRNLTKFDKDKCEVLQLG